MGVADDQLTGNGDATVADAADASDSELAQPLLGRRLQMLRVAKGLSLAQVGHASGLSPSFVSVVEQGRSDISIGRLMRLMGVYGARIADLDPSPQSAEQLVVRDGRGTHVRSQSGVDLYLLTTDTDRAMMPVTTTFAPHARLTNLAPHDGETFLYMLEGTLLLEFEERPPEILRRGDSAYYRPDPPPVFTNIGEGPLRILGVVTPPNL